MKSVKVKKPKPSGCGCNSSTNPDSCCGRSASEAKPVCSSKSESEAKPVCSCKSKSEAKAVCSCKSESEAEAVCSCKSESEAKAVCSNNSSSQIIKVSTTLTANDVFGSWKARWGINRMNFKVLPGLYCVGNPGNSSPVLVTANYKMSFDCVRKELKHLDAFILVLDTKGINVWCAAGKGTFGTSELINRINKVNLSTVVTHRWIILPQLGAPGVAAHEVQKQTGFKVIYGPVKASDLPAFINNNLIADKKMREVQFTFKDRLVLTPMELVNAMKSLIFVFGILFILNALRFGQFGFWDFLALFGAIFVGSVLTPVLLPWIPGRAFAFKGVLLGLVWAISVIYLNQMPQFNSFSVIKRLAYFLILPSLSSYIAMNFTGCSTYTSLSGVKREMKIAVPIQIIGIGLGMILMIIDVFINF